LIELLIVAGIILTISAIALPNLMAALQQARVARAVGDLYAVQNDVEAFQASNGTLPKTLADVGRGALMDPWGHAYQYLNFVDTKGKGAMRKDRFLVPINSDYDLYSVGADGKSVPPLTASVSQDDVVRASDGSYVGLASNY
jgi:general secretion pathway protein G